MNAQTATTTRPGPSRIGEIERLLRIYLVDHDGASSGGVRLANRSRKSNKHTIYASPLATLATEIREDQAELRRILESLRIVPSKTKRAAAWAGATLGGFKPNGQILGYSPLSRVVELEALTSAVAAKLRLWTTLGDLAKVDRRLDETKLAELQKRARSQLDSLAELHCKAADDAFATGQGRP